MAEKSGNKNKQLSAVYFEPLIDTQKQLNK